MSDSTVRYVAGVASSVVLTAIGFGGLAAGIPYSGWAVAVGLLGFFCVV